MALTRARAFFVFLLALQIADIFTTGGAYAAPRALEANPAARFLMLYFGEAWWWPKFILIAVIGLVVYRGHPSSRAVRLVGLVACADALVVTWNILNAVADQLVT